MPAWPLERCDRMKEAEIRKYAELMKEFGLTGLEITDDGTTIRLERNSSAAVREAVYSVPQSNSSVQPAPETKDYISINSPIVGVFYAAPAENAAPYVSIGDSIKKGQTLCIIEAMKLMNEITAEEDGTLVEVCVTNGQVVEFGTELFRIKR